MPVAPFYLLFAGVNGAGKTTLFKSGVWQNGLDVATLKRVNRAVGMDRHLR
jgi:predicted ABC-type ATPase